MAVNCVPEMNKPRRKAGALRREHKSGEEKTQLCFCNVVVPLRLHAESLLHDLPVQIDVETFDLDGLADSDPD